MPFDEQVSSALSALRPQLDVFRFGASSTLERARSMLTADAARGGRANGRDFGVDEHQRHDIRRIGSS